MLNHFSFHKLLVFLGLRLRTPYKDPLTGLVEYIDRQLSYWIESGEIESKSLVIEHHLIGSLTKDFVKKLNERYSNLLVIELDCALDMEGPTFLRVREAASVEPDVSEKLKQMLLPHKG